MTREELIREYQLFHFASTGIGSLVGPTMHYEVYERLSRLGTEPLSKVQLNQLLVLCRAGSMSDGLFQYYWKTVPEHPYDVSSLPYFSQEMTAGAEHELTSHDHLSLGPIPPVR